MTAKRVMTYLWVQLNEAWNMLCTRAAASTLFVAGTSLFACIYIIGNLQLRNTPTIISAALQNAGPTHVQIKDWVAEYFSCADGTCKRVFKRLPNASYEVTTETLPLDSGQRLPAGAFTVRPDTVRLSHLISDKSMGSTTKDWLNENKVIALTDLVQCDKNVCRTGHTSVPVKTVRVGEKNWIQFTSSIDEHGRFGPQTLPPVVTSPADVPKIFSAVESHSQAIHFELALTLLAPILFWGLTFWIGSPTLFVAFASFLSARAIWFLFAGDILMAQASILPFMTLKNSSALSAFFSGWVAAALSNFIHAVWSDKKMESTHYRRVWATVSLLNLIGSYLVPQTNTAAAHWLRSMDIFVMLTGAAASALLLGVHTWSQWNNRFADFMRQHMRTDMQVRWRGLLICLMATFSICTLLGLWSTAGETPENSPLFWSAFILPVVGAFGLMHAKPQLTLDDLKKQKELMVQQEMLVKLLAQLGSFKHRSQAISLVVNFCNRELPKLGFEQPQWSESRSSSEQSTASTDFEVTLESCVKSQRHTYGWLMAKARKRTENTAIGERIIESLSSALGQHLDNIQRTGLLENEIVASQKFIPRDVLKLFSINLEQSLEVESPYTLTASVVCVSFKADVKNQIDAQRMGPDQVPGELARMIVLQAAEHNGCVIQRDGHRWLLAFRDTPHAALRWIEGTQTFLRRWNDQRHAQGQSSYQGFYGIDQSEISLNFSEDSGQIRPWMSADGEKIASTLADLASSYSVHTLLSQDFLDSLNTAPRGMDVPENIRPLDRVWNTSKTKVIDIHEFFGGDPDSRRLAKKRTVALFSEGVRLYLSGAFDGARGVISQILQNDPLDKTAERLLGNLTHGDDLRAA